MGIRAEIDEELVSKVCMGVVKEIWDFVNWKQDWLRLVNDERFDQLIDVDLAEVKELLEAIHDNYEENMPPQAIPRDVLMRKLGIVSMQDIIGRNNGKK